MALTDKVIAITGAASGMGEASAHLFAQQGAKLVLADRDQARGEEVAAMVNASGGLAEFITTDVTEEQGDRGDGRPGRRKILLPRWRG